VFSLALLCMLIIFFAVNVYPLESGLLPGEPRSVETSYEPWSRSLVGDTFLLCAMVIGVSIGIFSINSLGLTVPTDVFLLMATWNFSVGFSDIELLAPSLDWWRQGWGSLASFFCGNEDFLPEEPPLLFPLLPDLLCYGFLVPSAPNDFLSCSSNRLAALFPLVGMCSFTSIWYCDLTLLNGYWIEIDLDLSTRRPFLMIFCCGFSETAWECRCWLNRDRVEASDPSLLFCFKSIRLLGTKVASDCPREDTIIAKFETSISLYDDDYLIRFRRLVSRILGFVIRSS